MQVPQEVVAAARAVYGTHLPGRRLLSRVDADPDTDEGEGQARTLEYAGEGLAVRVDVEPRDDGLAYLTVHLDPPLAAEVELQHPRPALAMVTRGEPPFRLVGVPLGLTRVLVTAGSLTAAPRHWQTSWTRL